MNNREENGVDEYLANGANKFETIILNEIKHIIKANDRHDNKLDAVQADIFQRREKMNDCWNDLFGRLSILETKTKYTSALVAVIVAGLISVAFGSLTAEPQAIVKETPKAIIQTEVVVDTIGVVK